MDGDLVGGGVEDGRHSKMEEACFKEHLISFTSWCYLNCYQTASTCPSNPGQSFVAPRQ